ncbi:MAG TPA: cytochrome C oxidase subunit IV family protein [Ilumatobacteraceae bacterium]|nr:cytochrome C oxidase subunit IV family protein [Ilumatobacteraceae bacterium]
MSAETTHHILPESAEEDAHDPSKVHQISDKQYIVIAIILAVVTALEIASTEVGLGAFLVPALLIMMVIKFVIVVSYFMHLKHDSAMFKFAFYVGLGGAIVLYTAVLATFHFFGS